MIDKDIFVGKEYKLFLDNYRVYKDGFIINEKTSRLSNPKNFKETKSGACPSFIFRIDGVGSASSMRFDKIIANLFCDKPLDSNGKEYPSYKILHKDGDMTNCSADNLEWVSPERIRTYSNGNTICEYPDFIKGSHNRELRKYILIDTWKKTWYEDIRENILKSLDICTKTFAKKLKNSDLINNRYILTSDISLTLDLC